MTWSVRLAKEAANQLKELPPDRQEFVLSHLRAMKDDPFSGDLVRLKGQQWKGRFRKRVGRYRLIFTPYYSEHVIEISQILIRSEKTYR